MIRHRVGLLVGLACTAIVLSGCDGTPDPTPSTTAPLFATEAEAFAAAEATYRAYVDAGNERRSGRQIDPSVFLTGEALQGELDGRIWLEEQGLRIEGSTDVVAFEGRQWSATSVEALACLDATGTRVLDDSGADVTPADRDDRASFDVAFVTANGTLLIATSRPSSESVCPTS